MKTNVQMILTKTTPLLTAEEEIKIFKRYVDVKTCIATWGPDFSSRSTLNRLKKEKKKIQDRIVSANLPAVVRIAGGLRTLPGMTRDDFISEGLLKLLECIEAFRPDRGYKFSTYLYRSMYRMFWRFLAQQQKRNKGRLWDTDGLFNDELLADVTNNADLWDLKTVFRKNLAGLSDIERFVIKHSFGIGGNVKAKTLKQMRILMKPADRLSSSRLQQILAKAIKKLGTVFIEGDK